MAYWYETMGVIDSIMSFDLIYTLILFGLVSLVAIAYLIRVAIKGRAQFDRVDRQGGSALLSKGLMEMGYWSLQPVARLLILLRVTPNMVSWSSLVFGLFAGICLASGYFGFGAIFACVSFLLDALDGMIARMTGKTSKGGIVLDSSLDRYVEFFFLAGLVLRYREIPAIQVIALAALLGSFMVSYSTAKAEALHVEPPRGNMKRPERALYLTLGAALSPLTIPLLEANREFPIPIAHPMVIALCLVAVLANVSAAERLWAVAKAVSERDREESKAAEQATAASVVSEDDDEPMTEPYKIR